MYIYIYIYIYIYDMYNIIKLMIAINKIYIQENRNKIQKNFILNMIDKH